MGVGKSIDTKFSVWHRRCTDTMPVTLGPVGVRRNKFGRAMYGIAATPLDARSQVPRAIEAISGR